MWLFWGCQLSDSGCQVPDTWGNSVLWFQLPAFRPPQLTPCRHAAFLSWPTLLTCEFEKKEGEEEDEASATGFGSGLFHSKRWVRHIRRSHHVPGSSWIPPTLDLQLANEKWNLKTSVWTLWVNWIYRLNWGEITVCSIDFSYLGICCHYLIHFSLPSFNENYSLHIVNFLLGSFHGYFQVFFLLWWFF